MEWVKPGGVRIKPKPLPYTKWGKVKTDVKKDALLQPKTEKRLPDPTEQSFFLGYTPLLDPNTGDLREAEVRMTYHWTDSCLPEMEAETIQELSEIPHPLSVFPSWHEAMAWKRKPGNLLVTDGFDFDDLVIQRTGHRTYTVDDGRIKFRLTGQSDNHAMNQLMTFMTGRPVDVSEAVLH